MELNPKKQEYYFKLSQYYPVFLPALAWLLFLCFLNEFAPNLSLNHLNILHFFIELFCSFISFASFITIWSVEKYQPKNHIFSGFLLLLLSICLIFHSYYGININLDPLSFNKSKYYLFLSQFVQLLLIISICFKNPKLKISRYYLLAITLIIASFFIFLTEKDIYLNINFKSNIYNALDFLICLLCLTNFILKEKKELLLKRYIILAVIFNILANSFFFTNTDFFNNSLSRLFECLCMIYLFKGIFYDYIINPYKKLHNQKNRIISVTNHLPLGLITYNNKNQEIIFYNDQAAKTLPAIKELLNNNTSLAQQTITLIDNDNKPVTLKLSVYPIENDHSLILSCNTDQEQLLANLQLQTTAILNSLTTPVLILNQNKIIVSCNQSFTVVTGYPIANILGLNIKQLKALLELKKIGTSKNNMYEYSLTTANQNRKDIHLHFSPLYDPSQKFRGNIIFALDVTENNEQQEKLSQQEKLAALGKMAAGIVHEIKNPLTTMKGFCQMITLNSRNEKVLKYAKTIENEIIDLNKVVNEFLNFAKPQVPVLKKINLNQLLKSMEVLMEGNCFMKNIELKFLFESFSQNILADESQLKQVLINIMENAIDAVSAEKEPLIIIETGLNLNEKECYVAITDNGEGMSEERKGNIGTPFYTTKDKGTGLGLSICFQIIKKHKGKITIKSELNKGTSFILTFPIKEEEI